MIPKNEEDTKLLGWGQKSELYQSNGSLQWAKAVRTVASQVWPTQERRMDKMENTLLMHAWL